jgi:hypothetical protein
MVSRVVVFNSVFLGRGDLPHVVAPGDERRLIGEGERGRWQI